MLAKVAERVYWISRYLERIENTARIIDVYDQLLYDLPTEVSISWYSLIELSGLEQPYAETPGLKCESDVIQFLISDLSNPSSIASNLKMIRENVRTTRDVLPEQTWEQINEFNYYLLSHLHDGNVRHTRHSFLKHIVGRCQRLHGLLTSTMAHDEAWQFLRLGRDIERADMSTRIIDSGAAALIEENGEASINLEQVIWGHVLRSAEASSSYRRIIRGPVSGEDVISFLLADDQFPRSVAFCIREMRESASQLPHGERLSSEAMRLLLGTLSEAITNRSALSLRDYINQLQIEISDLHNIIAQRWFGYQSFEDDLFELIAEA